MFDKILYRFIIGFVNRNVKIILYVREKKLSDD